MSISDDGPILLNADEVATLLTVSRTTFNGMVRDGAFIEPILLAPAKDSGVRAATTSLATSRARLSALITPAKTA